MRENDRRKLDHATLVQMRFRAVDAVGDGIHPEDVTAAQGLLPFATYTGSFTATRFIDYCKKLMNDTDGPVYLVVDGLPTQRAKTVKQFVASTDGRLKLFVLPAYSPQLNPDEWVWKNVKADRVGHTMVHGAGEFHARVIAALRRLQIMPQLVRGFFADPDLRYITN